MRFWIFWMVLTLGFWLSYPAHGQQTTSSNLLATPSLNAGGAGNPVPAGWTTSGMIGGASSDNPALGGYTFSYQSGTIAQTYAINQALKGVGSGIVIHGFNYGWEYTFACANQIGGSCTNVSGLQDVLNATVTITNSAGVSIYSQYYGLGQKNINDGNAPYNPTWQQVNTQQRFASPYSLANIGNFTMSFTGMDAGYWGGNYGPTIRNAYSQAVYGPDLCAQNPLSDPTCPGYAAALLAQQCTANPLSDPTCPGYAQAQFTQQCTINPLYEPACPGYQQALFQQQCQLNPLSSPQCPNYSIVSQATTGTTTTTTSTSSTTTVSVTGTVSTTEPTISIATDGTVSTGVATVPDTQVNTVITRKIESTASPTGTVTIQVQTQPAKESDEKKQLRTATEAERELAMKEEKKREEEASERRKQLLERQRRAAQENALSQGRRAIEQADRAQTMDEQMANQALIVATMNFVPGFDAYGTVRLPDAAGYRPYEIYRGQQNVDNRRLIRGLAGAQEQRHADMVDSQYGK